MKIMSTIAFQHGRLLRLTAAGLLLTVAIGAQQPGVVARDAWARLPLPSARETAVFLVVENHTDQKRAIISVTCDAAEAAEVHEMIMQRSIMKMVPVAQVSIGAHGKKSFNPNDMHIMLFGLKTKPAAGDVIAVTLKLDDGTTVPVTATFRK